MIHKTSKVHVLSIGSKMSIQDTIAKVHDKWCVESKISKDASFMIGDWTGWTKITDIKLHSVVNWVHLVPTNSMFDGIEGLDIILGEDTLLPIYNPTNKSSEFHGEVKYNYEIKQLKDVIADGGTIFMRNRSMNNFYEDNNQFIRMKAIPDTSLTADIAYEIRTQSGFFNVNNFHLLSSEAKNEELIGWK